MEGELHELRILSVYSSNFINIGKQELPRNNTERRPSVANDKAQLSLGGQLSPVSIIDIIIIRIRSTLLIIDCHCGFFDGPEIINNKEFIRE